MISVPRATSGTCSAGWGGGGVFRREHLAMAMMQGGTTPGKSMSVGETLP
jgi:hypothetical protein